MSEWLKEHDWKSCDGGTRPEVQILFSAPKKDNTLYGVFSFLPQIVPQRNTINIKKRQKIYLTFTVYRGIIKI